MATVDQQTGPLPPTAFERAFVLHVVTLTMTAAVSLTFLFGFGNAWALALRLGVTPRVAPLVAPAVDLCVIGLLLRNWHLAVHGARPEVLRPSRRLLVFAGLMTLALNVAEPILAGHTSNAAFDAVGPLLLIGREEVGPGVSSLSSAAATSSFTSLVARV